MVSDTYLALATAYRDDAPDLREWIEFHRLMGIERFFLYDNGSTDDHREVLAPYVREGTVVVHDWPIPVMGDTGRPSGLIRAFDHCVSEHRDGPRWIGFVGKEAYRGAFRERPALGVQPRSLADTRLFVLPSTSPANAAVPWGERLRWFRELAELSKG